MFVDEAGWGQPRDDAPKAVLTKRQERVVLRLLLANVLFLLVAPIGGGTVVEAAMALFSWLR